MYDNGEREYGETYYKETQTLVEDNIAHSLLSPTKKDDVTRGFDLRKVNRIAGREGKRERVFGSERV